MYLHLPTGTGLESAVPKCNRFRSSHATRSMLHSTPLNTGLTIPSVHDFFQPQPIKNASVFFLRAVAHNWSDGPLITMLTHLRDAATPETKLVIVDWILPYACANTSVEEVPGSVPAKPAPAPLLPSYGYPNITCFHHDAMVGSYSLSSLPN